MNKWKPVTKFVDLSDARLMTIVTDCNAAYADDCYGTSDLHNLFGAAQALEKRGYKISGVRKLRFKKGSRKQA